MSPVVARALGRPAVVDATALIVDTVTRSVRAGDRVLAEGATVTLDGTSGEVVIGSPGTVTANAGPHLGRLLDWADAISGDSSPRSGEQRLSDARGAMNDRAGPSREP